MGTKIDKTKFESKRLITEIIFFGIFFPVYALTAWALTGQAAWLPGGDPTAWGLFLLGAKNFATKMIYVSIAVPFFHFSRKAIFHKTDLTDMIHGTNGGRNVPVAVRSACVWGTYLWIPLMVIAFALMM